MRVPVAAYRLMFQVAEADGGLGAGEIELLKQYRRALGLKKEDLDRETVTPVTQRMIEGSEREREEALLAMARVAHADGRLSTEERDHLQDVGHLLGVGRVQIANVLDQAGHEDRGPKKHPGRSIALLAAGFAVVLSSITLFNRGGVRAETAKLLQDVALAAEPGVLLVYSDYVLTDGNDKVTGRASGTGFFVSDDGLFVTCKHVVERWKFDREHAPLLAQGWRVLKSRLSVWPAGSQVLTRTNQIDHGKAYTLAKGTLEIVSLPEDHLDAKGVHSLDSSDLALLRIAVDGPAHALPLAAPERAITALDPVVVLAFPRGPRLLERGLAVTTPSPGVVRKIEESILVSSSIYPGSSGGPLLNEQGEVIGVVGRRSMGDEGLGWCHRAVHVRSLLP